MNEIYALIANLCVTLWVIRFCINHYKLNILQTILFDILITTFIIYIIILSVSGVVSLNASKFSFSTKQNMNLDYQIRDKIELTTIYGDIVIGFFKL